MTGAIFLDKEEEQHKNKDTSAALKKRRGGKGNQGSGKKTAPDQAQPKYYGTEPDAPPNEPPPFTLEDIRKQIPAHCFERPLWKSMMHLMQDLALAAILFYAATWINHPAVPTWLTYVLWPVYWYLEGCILTGVWVIAHECGHGGFSDKKWVNDLVGLICHSGLLVPYHSWRISHGNHHKNTCSVEHDEVFVAQTRSEMGEMINDTPIVNLLFIVNMLLLGWPGYLITNMSGPAKYQGKKSSHFDPGAALFRANQAKDVVISDMGLIVALAILGFCVHSYGFGNVAFYYIIPYLVVNCHLVLITFLQHTDTYIPHYNEDNFTWLRGALATVDRSYGWFLDACFHHIADTHVCHHLFHYMPWYHATEATEAMKPLLGKYYLKDETPIYQATYRSWSKCRFVEDEGEVLFYKGKEDL
eukprot:gb/GECG01005160.1/.p1 GENE.gb/GECG01005160.1/~~gb/GECG01005160.1/.p1  ORF type:complete len:415 (+),score=37.96 gb/GECG01005160.1/:1-1245(+)